MDQRQTTLSNGLRIITAAMPGAQSVTASILAGVGGRYEHFETEGGVSHFLEHLLFKGTKSRPTAKLIAEQMAAVGGRNNAYTTSDLTNFHIKLPHQHLELALDILADMLHGSLLDGAEVDRERGVVIEEMNMSRDEPARYVFDLVPPLLWPGDGLGQLTIGSEDLIRSISRADIVAFWKRYYQPANLVVAVAGKVDHEAVVAQMERLWGRLPKGRPASVGRLATGLSPLRHSVVERDSNQAHIVVATRGYEYWHPDDAAANIITGILGRGMSSRLFINVRERQGLAYSINAGYYNFVDSGGFEVYAGANLDKADQTLTAILAELELIRHEPVPLAELDKVKNQITAGMQMSLESNQQVAGHIGEQLVLLNQVKSVEEEMVELRAVTAADVTRVAAEMLAPARLRLAVVAPQPQPLAARFEDLVSAAGAANAA